MTHRQATGLLLDAGESEWWVTWSKTQLAPVKELCCLNRYEIASITTTVPDFDTCLIPAKHTLTKCGTYIFVEGKTD